MVRIKDKLIELNGIISNSQKVLLINHRKMDGDAYGSVLAITLLLRKLGKEVKCINDSKTPGTFKFVYPKEELFTPDLNLEDYGADIIISLDAASEEQLGDIYKNNKKVFEETKFIVIDHHPFNDGFGDIDIIDKDACSACEIVCDFIKENFYEDLICEDIATAVILGLIADTNSFINSNTTPNALKCASTMLKHGARHQEIIEELFKKTPFARTQLRANALFNLKSIDGKVIWTKITNEMFAKAGASFEEDTSGFVDSHLTPIDGSLILFVLYELPDGKVKASFRTKDDKYNMNEFCSYFGGGGHIRASGFTLDGFTIEQIEEKVLNLIKEKYDLG